MELRYLGQHLFALLPFTPDGHFDERKASIVTVLGVAWTFFIDHFMPAYTAVARTIPLTLLLFLWCADMISGMGASWICGYRDPVTKKTVLIDGKPITGWRALSGVWARAGFAKLVLWCSVLAVTYGIRVAHIYGGGFFSGVIEAAVIFWETGSVLKNLGRCFGHPGVEALGGLAEGHADKLTSGKK